MCVGLHATAQVETTPLESQPLDSKRSLDLTMSKRVCAETTGFTLRHGFGFVLA